MPALYAREEIDGKRSAGRIVDDALWCVGNFCFATGESSFAASNDAMPRSSLRAGRAAGLQCCSPVPLRCATSVFNIVISSNSIP